MTLIIEKPTGAKLNLARNFAQQSYMWEFPAQYGLWSPSNITTALWLDAADASTVTTVSGAVSQWNDKSGNSRNATQATAGSRPALTTAGQNGRNVITFDGSNDFMEFSDLTLNDNNTFVFSVYNRTAAGTHSVDVGSITQGTLAERGYGNWWFTDNILYSILRSTSAGIHGSASTATGPTLNSLARNSTGTQAWRNGTELGTRRTSGNTSNPVLNQIGRQGIAAAFNYTNGFIAEIIVGRFDINDADRQKVEGYLAHKWGLTANLPSDHPYKTVGPTP
jgi:hypothetical protein